MAAELQLAVPGPMVPEPYSVQQRRRETADTWTLELSAAGVPIETMPGQFSMLTAYGVGEVPISLSGRHDDGSLLHTVRGVGAITTELCRTPIGEVIGLQDATGRSTSRSTTTPCKTWLWMPLA